MRQQVWGHSLWGLGVVWGDFSSEGVEVFNGLGVLCLGLTQGLGFRV